MISYEKLQSIRFRIKHVPKDELNFNFDNSFNFWSKFGDIFVIIPDEFRLASRLSKGKLAFYRRDSEVMRLLSSGSANIVYDILFMLKKLIIK